MVVADPHVVEGVGGLSLRRVEASVAEAAAADAVVLLLTDHDAFDLPALAERASLFLDTRHRVVGENVEYL